MTSEAVIGKLSSLNARLAELTSLKQFAEMSDDRAFSNGKAASFDRDIAIVQHDIVTWYTNNALDISNAEETDRLSVSSNDGGKTFELSLCRFPSPGVMRQLSVKLNRDGAEKIIGFFGGVQVEYIGAHIDAVAAFTSIEKRFRNATEEIGALRRKVRELEETLTIKEQELGARYDDAHH